MLKLKPELLQYHETNLVSLVSLSALTLSAAYLAWGGGVTFFLNRLSFDEKPMNEIIAVTALLCLGNVAFFATACEALDCWQRKNKNTQVTWKLQPYRGYLTREAKKAKAIRLSLINSLVASLGSAVLITLHKKGLLVSGVYTNTPQDYFTFFKQPALLWLYNDLYAFTIHLGLHQNFFYKHFHKLHHEWKAPHPWTALALHPVEFSVLAFGTYLPLYLGLEIHLAALAMTLTLIHWYNTVDHTGIDTSRLKISPWPFAPNAKFHDDHHKHFYCNFGQTLTLWDWLYGSLHQVNENQVLLQSAPLYPRKKSTSLACCY